VQSIADIQLPKEVIDAPFYVVHFLAAFDANSRGDEPNALVELEECLGRSGALPQEKGDLQFLAGLTALFLSNQRGGYDPAATEVSMKAVKYLREAADVWKDSNKAKWAIAENNLAPAYIQLQSPNRIENLRNGLSSAKSALSVLSTENSPEEWARAQANLGTIYGEMRGIDGANALRQAISAFQDALTVRTKAKDSLKWAILQNDLGLAYRQLSEAGAGGNSEIRASIAYYRNALSVVSKENEPMSWAEFQHNLGNAYASLEPPEVDNAQKCYEAELEVFTRHSATIRWALAQCSLGKLNGIKGKKEKDKALLQKSINLLKGALEVISKDRLPFLWRDAWVSLGSAFLDYACLFQDDEMRARAVEAFENAHSMVNDLDTTPDTGRINYMLGFAYLGLRGGDLVTSARRARHCLEVAERSHWQESDPKAVAATKLALADAILRHMENPVKDFPKAKALVASALQLLDATKYPKEHEAAKQWLDQLDNAYIEVPSEFFKQAETPPGDIAR
jgi:tetratricopeptide (TPR) repeat protein